jgi:hypothetical protein
VMSTLHADPPPVDVAVLSVSAHCAASVWDALLHCSVKLDALAATGTVSGSVADDMDALSLATVAVQLALLKSRCIDSSLHRCSVQGAAAARKRARRQAAPSLTASLGWLVVDGVAAALNASDRERLLASQPGLAASRPVLTRLCLLGLAALEHHDLGAAAAPSEAAAAERSASAVRLIASACRAVPPTYLLGAIRTCQGTGSTAESTRRCLVLLQSVTAKPPVLRRFNRHALRRIFDGSGATASAALATRTLRKKRPRRGAASQRSAAASEDSESDDAVTSGGAASSADDAPVSESRGGAAAVLVDAPGHLGTTAAIILSTALPDRGSTTDRKCVAEQVLDDAVRSIVTADASTDSGVQYARCLGGGTDAFTVAANFGGAAVVVKVPMDHPLVRDGDGSVRDPLVSALSPSASRSRGARAAASAAISDTDGGNTAHVVCRLVSTSSVCSRGPSHLVVAELYDVLRRATLAPMSAVPHEAAVLVSSVAHRLASGAHGRYAATAGAVAAAPRRRGDVTGVQAAPAEPAPLLSFRDALAAVGGGGGGGGGGGRSSGGTIIRLTTLWDTFTVDVEGSTRLDWPDDGVDRARRREWRACDSKSTARVSFTLHGVLPFVSRCRGVRVCVGQRCDAAAVARGRRGS